MLNDGKSVNDGTMDDGTIVDDETMVVLLLLLLMMILVVVPRRGGMSCDLTRRMMALEARIAPVGSGADVGVGSVGRQGAGS